MPSDLLSGTTHQQPSHLNPSLPRPHSYPAMMVPTPYDFPWTGHLIIRDLKTMKDKVKTKTKAKVKKIFGRSKRPLKNGADDSHDPDNSCAVGDVPDRDQEKYDVRRRGRKDKKAAPERQTIAQDDAAARLPPSPETPPQTEAPVELDFDFTDLFADFDWDHEIDGIDSTSIVEEPDDFYTPEEHNNFYFNMQRHVDVYYTTRPKDLDRQDRWMVRGLTVFLYLVILNCPLNPSYGDLGKGQSCFDKMAFEIAILQHTNIDSLNAIESTLRRKAVRVSKMPGGLNEKASSMHLRVDSVMTEEPGSFEQANQIENGALEAAPLSPTQLWYAFQVACTEPSKTQSIVEGLLGLVEPEMDARKFLVRMGDPAQMVPMEEKEILRHKLRTVLFPEYDTLS